MRDFLLFFRFRLFKEKFPLNFFSFFLLRMCVCVFVVYIFLIAHMTAQSGPVTL